MSDNNTTTDVFVALKVFLKFKVYFGFVVQTLVSMYICGLMYDNHNIVLYQVLRGRITDISKVTRTQSIAIVNIITPTVYSIHIIIYYTPNETINVPIITT